MRCIFQFIPAGAAAFTPPQSMRLTAAAPHHMLLTSIKNMKIIYQIALNFKHLLLKYS